MAVTITPADELPSEADVEAFEIDIGFRIPAAYRAFLLRYNSPNFPEPDDPSAVWTLGFEAKTDPQIQPDHFWDIAVLDGLWRDPSRYALREVYGAMLDWGHPPEMLPIGNSIGNTKYFLCLAGPRTCAVMVAGEAYLEKYSQGGTITPDDYQILVESFEEMIERLEWRAYRG